MKRNYVAVGLVLLTFFVMSLITNILNPIMPAIIDSYKLSLKLGGFLPTSLFIAYLISIPAGMLIERKGESMVKRVALHATPVSYARTDSEAIFCACGTDKSRQMTKV